MSPEALTPRQTAHLCFFPDTSSNLTLLCGRDCVRPNPRHTAHPRPLGHLDSARPRLASLLPGRPARPGGQGLLPLHLPRHGFRGVWSKSRLYKTVREKLEHTVRLSRWPQGGLMLCLTSIQRASGINELAAPLPVDRSGHAPGSFSAQFGQCRPSQHNSHSRSAHVPKAHWLW